MSDNNNLRMTLKSALDNLWSRISGIFGTVNSRIDGAEAHIDSVEDRVTTAEGQIAGLDNRVDDLEDAVDDLEGDMIKSITFNGTAVPKDAQGNVALQETDPTVPAWAKQVKAKTSDFTNDGDGTDNNSPFATQAYVRVNGGKIDEVQVNGTALSIVNKAVNVPVPTLISQLINDAGYTRDAIIDVDYGGQYISDIYPYLNDEISNNEIRRFRAGILSINLLTNSGINVPVWGFIYRWDEGNAADDVWYTMVCYEEYSGCACYYARIYSNERDYRREIVHVDTVFQFGSGGGGTGAVNTITFNGSTYQPDANGNVSFSFTETDPTVPSWAKNASKPTYTAQEVGAKAIQSPVSDPAASGTALAFIASLSQNAQGVISPTKKTIQSASQSAAGLMSAADKTKLDGIAAGAAVTSVNNQTGAVSITPASIGAAEKQLCESPNSQWRLEIHNDGIIRVWRYDANLGWNIAGVLRDENGVVPVLFGGTGATTSADALANLGVINRQFSVTFDSNGFGTVNYPPQGYTLMAGNLDPSRIITVQGEYVVARSISDWTSVISGQTLTVTLLYVKNN